MKCPFCIKVCKHCEKRIGEARILVAYGGNFAKMKAGKYGFTSQCKECAKEYSKEHYENNKEAKKEWQKEYYNDNKQHHKEVMKQWREDNPEYFKELMKQWREDNPEYMKQWHEDNPEYMKQHYENNKEHKKEYDKQKYDKYLKENGLERGQGSIGEQKVRQVLSNMNIEFEEQYRFNDCKFKATLPFDFYIPSLNTIVEYDGRQHFEATGGWSDEEFLKGIQERDTIKNDYCRRNNIRLIRIPYYEFDNIEQILSDLL